ncbi:TIGR03564 family F420-dependent LLM class oxidoreductase [Nocardia carnea]|uniref:TIGR03564 family F420-dependent LLM class oxidoreductase n=1 Tax=Nocardia carnea TaxID=37328 RepID=A0ABW7TPM9_9NOCA|nr:TIGR03564 family F420-dependent LLM class oxidoreductase [Nocardia carnea]
MTMRIGVLVHEQGSTVDTLVERAHAAAAAGLRSVWLGQHFGWDALTAAAVIGREVPAVEVGTAVVPTYPRHPMMLAGQALTVQSAVGSRLTLGIGVSHPHIIEGQLGYDFRRPAHHLREYLDVLMPLLRGEEVAFTGSEITAVGRIGTEPTPSPSVLIGALGPAMLRIAGESADGTVTTWVGPAALENHVVPVLTRAAGEAGRPRPRIVVCLFVAITEAADDLRTELAGRFGAAGGIGSYRAAMEREGVTGPEQTALLGDEKTVERLIGSVFAAGATELVAMPVGSAAEQSRTLQFLGALTAR